MNPEGAGYGEVRPAELKRRLEADEDMFLLDVREEWEFGLARIEGSTLTPMSSIPERIEKLNPGRAWNLEGGLDAYADFDESVGLY